MKMNRLRLYLAFLYCIFIISSCGQEKSTSIQETRKLPNILFILADDLGWSQLGCYGGPYSTPNIDQFATEGMLFTQAYTSAAVCSPTRAALMTGRYPARLNLTDFIKGDETPDKPLQQPEWQKFLPLEEVTIAELLKEHGYKTAAFGKWHLSQEKIPPLSLPFNPDKQGFDEYMVTYKPRKNNDPESDPHNIDAITNRAMRFLEENKDSSFFLYVSHNAIHDPIMESKQLIQQFEGDSLLWERNIKPTLAAMVNHLDTGIGRLLKKLNELGLNENTLVIFYSDNGGKEAYASQYPFRKGKGWLYEGGIRVPLLVRFPSKIEAGSQANHVLSTIDFFPTILKSVGLQIPENIDGRSFWEVLTGSSQGSDESIQYWHYPHYHRGSGMKPASALRKGKYKLIAWHEQLLSGESAYELYDLESDPSEEQNLAEQLPEVKETLSKALSEWQKEVNAQMPILKNIE
ncbi:MAG: sulfatase [Bacteroidota bacterium]